MAARPANIRPRIANETESPIMNEAPSTQPKEASSVERFVGAKAKQLSLTAAERARELRKAAARQRLIRLKLQELENDEQEGGASNHRKREAAVSNGDLMTSLSEANWDEVKAYLDNIHREAERYVRQNPTKSVLAAVGAGFVLGLLMKR